MVAKLMNDKLFQFRSRVLKKSRQVLLPEGSDVFKSQCKRGIFSETFSFNDGGVMSVFGALPSF